MSHLRPRLALLLAAGSLGLAAAGCQTDDAVERDTRETRKDVKDAGKEAKKDTEKAVEDVDGK